MIEQDTIKLLRECDAGIKMGVASIEDVIEYVSDEKMKSILTEGKREHKLLEEECEKRLASFKDEGKEPQALAKGMSWLKTSIMLTLNDSDATIADLMTDGCNMGVKSLNKYLNKYKAAEEYSKSIAKHLIQLEEGLSRDMREYL